jgi:uncharacterized protein with PIN domain
MIVDTSALIAFCATSPKTGKLNFGDCFAYPLAKFTGEPLLFKGDDFAHTDTERRPLSAAVR